MNICIIASLQGGHKIVNTTFNRTEMNQISKRFSENVEYIWIHSDDSEKFVKFAEKKEGNKIIQIPDSRCLC